MCTGIRDAANLAWKLIECLGGADESLLDTYQAERAPHARVYVETAKRLGGLINALDKDAALKMADGENASVAQMRSIAPKLGPSPLSIVGSIDCVGRPFAQLDLGEGKRRSDDFIGYRHTVISRDRPNELPPRVQWLNPNDHPALAKALKNLDAAAIWVRPDRYVGAASDSARDLLTPLYGFLETERPRQDGAKHP